MPQANQQIGPITLQPIFVERIWGEQTISSWYQQPMPGKPIGEAWLTAEECTPEGSATTLAQLVASAPAEFGDSESHGFPLLIKFLYPREKLSVQVHPNDEQAKATLNQPRGKTECWYVLSAEAGAQVAAGFNEPLTNDEVQTSINDGSIESKLRYIPVKPGDMIFVDAGTVHAIGPGMVVLETQQYSDVTYRLWDYGRPRELHVKDGMAVTRTQTEAGLVESVQMNGFTRLVSCEYFNVDRFYLDAVKSAPLGESKRLQILIALTEGASIDGNGTSLVLRPGYATLLPAEGIEYMLKTNDQAEIIRILQ